ncbi:hypothetical protein B0H19DRAFT_114359 [Mycena capillaripes]|nr:hypothetical protein B0H19DRAFT_114359 [Mycena capillaripes]
MRPSFPASVFLAFTLFALAGDSKKKRARHTAISLAAPGSLMDDVEPTKRDALRAAGCNSAHREVLREPPGWTVYRRPVG